MTFVEIIITVVSAIAPVLAAGAAAAFLALVITYAVDPHESGED